MFVLFLTPLYIYMTGIFVVTYVHACTYISSRYIQPLVQFVRNALIIFKQLFCVSVYIYLGCSMIIRKPRIFSLKSRNS